MSLVLSLTLVGRDFNPAWRAGPEEPASLLLTLTLLVLLVRTDDADHAAPPHHLALVTHPLDRSPDLHVSHPRGSGPLDPRLIGIGDAGLSDDRRSWGQENTRGQEISN